MHEKFFWIEKRYLSDDGAVGKSPQEWIKGPQNLLIFLKPVKGFDLALADDQHGFVLDNLKGLS